MPDQSEDRQSEDQKETRRQEQQEAPLKNPPVSQRDQGPNTTIIAIMIVLGVIIGTVIRDTLDQRQEQLTRSNAGVVIEILTETPTPSSTPTPLIVSREESLEREMIELVNHQRKLNNLAPLRIDQELTEVAVFRSEDMARKNYFGHNPPNGCGAFCLLKRWGYSFAYAAENLAWNNYSNQDTLETAMDDLMDSKKHRENILSCHYEKIGVGVVKVGKEYYYTQIFEGIFYC